MRNVSRAFALAALVMASYAVPAQSKSDPIVYVVEAGKAYHKKNCRLKQGSKGIKLSEAKKKGFKACKVCKP